MRSIPMTRSQSWARGHNACYAGRRRLGGKTVFNYFRQLKRIEDISDLLWVATKLGRDALLRGHNPSEEEVRFANYSHALDEVWERWRGKPHRVVYTRRGLLRTMRLHNVGWPVDTLVDV